MDYLTCPGKDKTQECPLRDDCRRFKMKGKFGNEEETMNIIPYNGTCSKFKQDQEFNDFYPHYEM